MAFKKAVKHEAKLRMALAGPAGSGKTYSALAIATALADGGKIAVIDTERGSASLYADIFDFDVIELTTFHPDLYIQAIKEAEREGYAVIVIDSLTHAWNGIGGLLELHDRATKKSGNSYTAWSDITPIQNRFIDSMLGSTMHVITTMRSKTDYIMTQDAGNKTKIQKVGMAPIQRDGMDFEFTVFGELDLSHNLSISKTRCPLLTDLVFNKPGEDIAGILREWLKGVPASAQAETHNAPASTSTVPSQTQTSTVDMPTPTMITRLREYYTKLGESIPADMDTWSRGRAGAVINELKDRIAKNEQAQTTQPSSSDDERKRIGEAVKAEGVKLGLPADWLVSYATQHHIPAAKLLATLQDTEPAVLLCLQAYHAIPLKDIQDYMAHAADHVLTWQEMKNALCDEPQRTDMLDVLKEDSQPVRPNTSGAPATDRQITSIRKLCTALNRPQPDTTTMTFTAARELLTELSHAYNDARHAAANGGAA